MLSFKKKVFSVSCFHNRGLFPWALQSLYRDPRDRLSIIVFEMSARVG